jgi:hypothetical protein
LCTFQKENAMKSPYHFSIAAVSLLLLSWLPTAANAVAVPGQGTWESTLFARDINGDGTVDAYFDSTRNVTWLADAKAIKGTSFDDGFNINDGKVTYDSAKTWLAGLNVYGVTGWRFPGADLVPMYGVTLGNSSIPGSPTTGWTNTGPFLNVPDFGVSGWYWRGDTPFQDNPFPAPGEPLKSNILAADSLGAPIYIVAVTASYNAWAVKSGDVPVAAIPEPTTWALMLLGVGALAWRQKSRRD